MARVRVYSPYPEHIIRAIEDSGDTVVAEDADFIVSYGHREIFRPEFIDRYPGRIINIHISLLPWNRGADPNFWSWFDGTPKGVTIHQIDAGIDTGDILAQEEFDFTGYDDTLENSYERLKCAAEILFRKVWPDIRDGKISPVKQTGKGSFHNARDKMPIFERHGITWQTKCSEIGHLRHLPERRRNSNAVVRRARPGAGDCTR